MKNIILIGMPGAGKSTVGVVLAKKLGYRFLDSDLVIQEQYGCILAELIEERGIEGFLTIEEEVNCSIETSGSVIATGGSAIYSRKAMEHFKENGIIIYLNLSLSSIEYRLGNLKNRGVVLKQNQTLEELYEERIPYYEKYADLTINCDRRAIRTIIEDAQKQFRAEIKKITT